MKTLQEEIVDLVARESNNGSLKLGLLEVLKGVKLKYKPRGVYSPYFSAPPVNSVGTIIGVCDHNTERSIAELGWIYVRVDFGVLQDVYRMPVNCAYEMSCMEVIQPKEPKVKRLGSFRITLRDR